MSILQSELQRDLQRNIFLVKPLAFLGDFILFVPVFVPFFRECGLSAQQVFYVQAVFSAAVLLAEIPSGYFSDVLGRRKALLTFSLLLTSGLLLYALGDNIVLFICAEVILALGWSLRSGTDSAILYDSLLSLKRPQDYRTLSGKNEALARLGTGVSSIAGGLLGMLWLRLPFVLNLVPAGFIILLASRLREPPRHRQDGTSPAKEIIQTVGDAWRIKGLPRLLLLQAVIFSGGISSLWLWMVVFDQRGVAPAWNGLLFAAAQFASAAGAGLSHRLETFLGRKLFFLSLLLIPAVLLCMACCDGPLVYGLPLVHSLLWGCSTPAILELLNQRVDSRRRATFLSLGSFLGRGLNIVFLTVTGSLTAAIGSWAGFVFLATVILAGQIFFFAGMAESE
jgi:MFS family permease